MIFDENFANFYDFSTNFCQLADFLPRGGGPRCFVKYSPVSVSTAAEKQKYSLSIEKRGRSKSKTETNAALSPCGKPIFTLQMVASSTTSSVV